MFPSSAEPCANCGSTGPEPLEPKLNEVFNDLLSATFRTGTPDLFGVSFEQYTHPSVDFRPWRCFIKVGSRIGTSSRRHHKDPGDALRELAELVQDRR